jgi:hypothetical protein
VFDAFYANRLQLLQALNRQNHNIRFQFCKDFQQWVEEDRFAENLVSGDEATFHVFSGQPSQHKHLGHGTSSCSGGTRP